MDTIKCGREVYELDNGDTVLDNGSCLQLITRTVRRGFYSHSPRVSKAAFKAFKKNENVKQNLDHRYGSNATLWTYTRVGAK
jgi:hypothetical protein